MSLLSLKTMDEDFSYSDKLIMPAFIPEYIYSIGCPDTGHIVYIGKTFKFKERCYNHRNGKTIVGSWVKAMQSIGKEPVFAIIDVTYGHGIKLEAHYIEYYRSLSQANFNKENAFVVRGRNIQAAKLV